MTVKMLIPLTMASSYKVETLKMIIKDVNNTPNKSQYNGTEIISNFEMF